ncbi:MAG: hypothetical protein CTY20_02000 [Hyphomicrobium sp.]|nr:MAG: hypothetical protein CTY20_02000 [Hyphomicrobium sp.]
MKPQHHLDVATLMSCAAGSQPEALAFIVASHLAVCPQCRADLGQASLIGSSLFEDLPSSGLGDARLVDVAWLSSRRDRSDDVHQTESGRADPSFVLAEQRGVHWMERDPGVNEADIQLSPSARGHLRLVRLAPSVPIPQRLRDVAELTFVVSGGLINTDQKLQAGDVLDGVVAHQAALTADATHGCVCLMGKY